MLDYTCTRRTDAVIQITDPTGVSAYLVLGDTRAALLDTCVGIRGLKEAVGDQTDLPVTVILTHGHGDHAGGAAAFGEVWMHPADRDLIRQHGLAMRMDYAGAMLPPGQTLLPEQFEPEPQGGFRGLADGQVFDLGGVHLEIIHVPGHTKGSCCVLIPEERAILFGDACNTNTLVLDENSTDISTYRKSLEHLKTFEPRYDTVYYSHGPGTGPSALDDNIELCGRILAGTDDAVPCEFMGRQAIRAAEVRNGFDRTDGGYGNIVYSELTRK